MWSSYGQFLRALLMALRENSTLIRSRLQFLKAPRFLQFLPQAGRTQTFQQPLPPGSGKGGL
jgi:hypothetical protein